ncbi:uncharacterized protein [Paramormyrops kingsleyae]|uniref:uncharacterized protein isoform X3 n=1 Tax=Paramormyrops kingsleyae TaxID=1676925 RepID=UPI003B97AF5F
MDQKPPQLSVADVKEEAQDVLISDVDGAGHSSPDEAKWSAAGVGPSCLLHSQKVESTACPVFNGEVKEETVFQDVTEEKLDGVRPPNPAPSASPRSTAATLPGPLNLAILIRPPAAYSVGPSTAATPPGAPNPAIRFHAPAAHSVGPSATATGPPNSAILIHPPAAHTVGPSDVDSNQDISKSEPGMKHQLTLLLLTTIKKHRSLYSTNKPAFYKRVHKDMLQRDHKCSLEQIRKKISNMLATYKRVKYRCQITGEAKINWDYYTIMDEIFGRSGVGSAPESRISSTPLSAPQPSAPEPDPAVLTKKTATDWDMGSKPASQAASFFESYEAHAERRTAVLEALVRPDLERFRRLKERRRRSFEKKVLTSLGQISKGLQEIAEGQAEMVKLLQNLQHK